MFRYRLHTADGDDLGEATYAQMIHPGEEIIAGNNQHSRVIDVVLFGEEDESPFVGLLKDEASQVLRRASHAVHGDVDSAESSRSERPISCTVHVWCACNSGYFSCKSPKRTCSQGTFPQPFPDLDTPLAAV